MQNRSNNSQNPPQPVVIEYPAYRVPLTDNFAYRFGKYGATTGFKVIGTITAEAPFFSMYFNKVGSVVFPLVESLHAGNSLSVAASDAARKAIASSIVSLSFKQFAKLVVRRSIPAFSFCYDGIKFIGPEIERAMEPIHQRILSPTPPQNEMERDFRMEMEAVYSRALLFINVAKGIKLAEKWVVDHLAFPSQIYTAHLAGHQKIENDISWKPAERPGRKLLNNAAEWFKGVKNDFLEVMKNSATSGIFFSSADAAMPAYNFGNLHRSRSYLFPQSTDYLSFGGAYSSGFYSPTSAALQLKYGKNDFLSPKFSGFSLPIESKPLDIRPTSTRPPIRDYSLLNSINNLPISFGVSGGSSTPIIIDVTIGASSALGKYAGLLGPVGLGVATGLMLATAAWGQGRRHAYEKLGNRVTNVLESYDDVAKNHVARLIETANEIIAKNDVAAMQAFIEQIPHELGFIAGKQGELAKNVQTLQNNGKAIIQVDKQTSDNAKKVYQDVGNQYAIFAATERDLADRVTINFHLAQNNINAARAYVNAAPQDQQASLTAYLEDKVRFNQFTQLEDSLNSNYGEKFIQEINDFQTKSSAENSQHAADGSRHVISLKQALADYDAAIAQGKTVEGINPQYLEQLQTRRNNLANVQQNILGKKFIQATEFANGNLLDKALTEIESLREYFPEHYANWNAALNVQIADPLVRFATSVFKDICKGTSFQSASEALAGIHAIHPHILPAAGGLIINKFNGNNLEYAAWKNVRDSILPQGDYLQKGRSAVMLASSAALAVVNVTALKRKLSPKTYARISTIASYMQTGVMLFDIAKGSAYPLVNIAPAAMNWAIDKLYFRGLQPETWMQCFGKDLTSTFVSTAITCKIPAPNIVTGLVLSVNCVLFAIRALTGSHTKEAQKNYHENNKAFIHGDQFLTVISRHRSQDSKKYNEEIKFFEDVSNSRELNYRYTYSLEDKKDTVNAVNAAYALHQKLTQGDYHLIPVTTRNSYMEALQTIADQVNQGGFKDENHDKRAEINDYIVSSLFVYHNLLAAEHYLLQSIRHFHHHDFEFDQIKDEILEDRKKRLTSCRERAAKLSAGDYHQAFGCILLQLFEQHKTRNELLYNEETTLLIALSSIFSEKISFVAQDAEREYTLEKILGSLITLSIAAKTFWVKICAKQILSCKALLAKTTNPIILSAIEDLQRELPDEEKFGPTVETRLLNRLISLELNPRPVSEKEISLLINEFFVDTTAGKTFKFIQDLGHNTKSLVEMYLRAALAFTYLFDSINLPADKQFKQYHDHLLNWILLTGYFPPIKKRVKRYLDDVGLSLDALQNQFDQWNISKKFRFLTVLYRNEKSLKLAASLSEKQQILNKLILESNREVDYQESSEENRLIAVNPEMNSLTVPVKPAVKIKNDLELKAMLNSLAVKAKKAPAFTPTKPKSISLNVAAQKGDIEAVIWALNRGERIEQRDDKDCTALHNAARAGHLDMVEILLERKANINATSTESKKTPLILAAQAKYLKVATLLLQHNAMLPPLDEKFEPQFDKLIHQQRFILACAKDNKDEVKQFCDQGMDLNYRDIRLAPEYKENNALHTSVQHGCIDVTKFLIAKGIDLTLKNARGKTAHASAKNQIEKLQKDLEDKEVSAQIKEEMKLDGQLRNIQECVLAIENEANEKLRVAVWSNDQKNVIYALDANANPNRIYIDTKYKGCSFLFYAFLKGYLKITQELLNKGANPSFVPDKGEWEDWPLLAYLIEHNSKEGEWGNKDPKSTEDKLKDDAISSLLRAGADPNIKVPAKANTWGNWSPLGYFIYKEKLELVRLALKKGADPNEILTEKGNAGWSLLAYAGYYGSSPIYKEIFVELLSHGARADFYISRWDLDGGLLAHLINWGYRDLVLYSLERGANPNGLLLGQDLAVYDHKKHGKKDSTNLWLIANKLFHSREYAEAIKHYQQILQINLLDAFACFHIAKAYFANDQINLASEWLDKAIKNNPSVREFNMMRKYINDEPKVKDSSQQKTASIALLSESGMFSQPRNLSSTADAKQAAAPAPRH